jgi:hypothetical protein
MFTKNIFAAYQLYCTTILFNLVCAGKAVKRRHAAKAAAFVHTGKYDMIELLKVSFALGASFRTCVILCIGLTVTVKGVACALSAGHRVVKPNTIVVRYKKLSMIIFIKIKR